MRKRTTIVHPRTLVCVVLVLVGAMLTTAAFATDHSRSALSPAWIVRGVAANRSIRGGPPST